MEGLFSAIPPILALSLLLSIGGSLDIILIVAFKSYRHWEIIRQFIETRVDLVNVIHISKYVTALFVGLQIWRFLAGLRQSDSCSDDFPVKPMLFPCQTSHVRMFPKKHGFSYSYLLVGIPIGWKGNSGGMISAEEEDPRTWYQRWNSVKPGLGWWTVNNEHYLARGHDKDGLAGKLREYLENQVCTLLTPQKQQLILSGHRSQTIRTCLPPHSSPLPKLRLQPCLNMASLLRPKRTQSLSPRSKQHLRRTPYLLPKTIIHFPSFQRS
jgi:hypothetical protein